MTLHTWCSEGSYSKRNICNPIYSANINYYFLLGRAIKLNNLVVVSALMQFKVLWVAKF